MAGMTDVIDGCIVMTYGSRTTGAGRERDLDARFFGYRSRYLQQAQRLKEPVPVSEVKLAFTVKLPGSLIERVRLYASVKRISISEVVSRALLALLPRGGGRG
jgi:hypothetical protein